MSHGRFLLCLAIAIALPVLVGAQPRSDATQSAPATPRDPAAEALLKRYQSADDPRELQRLFAELRTLAEKSPWAAYICGVLAAPAGSPVADRDAALQCLETAARSGLPEAQHRLALFLIERKDRITDAQRWLSASARSLPESVYVLALLKAGEQPNPDAARRTAIEKAAAAGYAPAQYDLARLRHAEGTAEGKAAARDLLENAAAQQHADAAAELALLLAEDRREQDIARIVALLERASAAGSIRADYALGIRLTNANGLKRDTERAFTLFRRAASRGDVPAMYATGSALNQGIGTGSDEAAAVEWFRRAAELGDANSMYALGNSYANGWGVGKSMDVAYGWYCKAAQAGSAPGAELVRRTRRDCAIDAPPSPSPPR